MTKIYLIRHGQTEWNKNLVFRGRADIPLNDMGLREADAIAGAFKGKSVDAIYTSPLIRSVETGRPSARLFNLEIIPVQGFIDISYGEWEGMTFSEVKSKYREEYRIWEKSPEMMRFPNGESLDEVKNRAFEAFINVVGKNEGNSILIIPHRVINKVLLCAILGIGNSYFWQIKQDTGCINLIEYSLNKYIISKINDTCHLKGIAGEKAQLDF